MNEIYDVKYAKMEFEADEKQVWVCTISTVEDEFFTASRDFHIFFNNEDLMKAEVLLLAHRLMDDTYTSRALNEIGRNGGI